MRRLLILLPCLCLASCTSKPAGPTLYPVTGQVIVNGKPAEGVAVTFHRPPGPVDEQPVLPVGTTDAEGKFTLKTSQGGGALLDGAPAGDYTVTMIWSPPGAPIRAHKDRFDGKMEKIEKGLPAHVNEGPTELKPFEVEAQLREFTPEEVKPKRGPQFQ